MDNPNRWKQRFQNFEKAYAQFNRALAIEEPSEFEKMALVKAFEFTHELCWNTMKDYLEEEGFTDLKGSKDTFRAAFKAEIIQEGEVWMESIDMRVASVHTYNHEVMDETVDFIRDKFAPLLNDWYHIFKDKEREQ